MAPRWALFWSIVVCMALYFLLTGCATTLDHREVIHWRTCDGRDRTTYVQVRTGVPALACPALAAQHATALDTLRVGLSLPLACVVRVEGEAWIILPPGAPSWLLEHEIQHIRGYEHGPLFMWPMTREC